MALAAAIWGARKYSHKRKPAGYPDQSSLSAFCVTFQPEDKILLFPPSVQTARLLREAVQRQWTVDSNERQDDCYVLNLAGAPFLKHSSRENALSLRWMCCQILETFKAHGWQLVLCTDLSCKSDLTAWYFARSPPDSLTDEELALAAANANDPAAAAAAAAVAANAAAAAAANSPDDRRSSFICLSLSKNCRLQIVNANVDLQQALKLSIESAYAPGIEKESHHGRDYEITLNGSPWDTRHRDEIVAACALTINVFRRLHLSGYQLYGIVNLKETADSFIFEYDPRQTDENDSYMIMEMHDENILRLVGVSEKVVRTVEATVIRHWEPGLASVQRIEQPEPASKPALTSRIDAWEFRLNGAPWQAKVSRIGKSRQLITLLLDELLAMGWTVASGLDTSRASDSKSVLLFQCCQAQPGLKHVCVSPLGKHSLQIINAPPDLLQLIRTEFEELATNEKLSSDECICELTLKDFPWDPDPQRDPDSYTEVRRRMGAFLQSLMDSQWMVIASADVAHEADNRLGIHSWFLVYCGQEREVNRFRVTANSVLHVAGRVGSSRSRAVSRDGSAGAC